MRQEPLASDQNTKLQETNENIMYSKYPTSSVGQSFSILYKKSHRWYTQLYNNNCHGANSQFLPFLMATTPPEAASIACKVGR